jgi:hypothetical protein
MAKKAGTYSYHSALKPSAVYILEARKPILVVLRALFRVKVYTFLRKQPNYSVCTQIKNGGYINRYVAIVINSQGCKSNIQLLLPTKLRILKHSNNSL